MCGVRRFTDRRSAGGLVDAAFTDGNDTQCSLAVNSLPPLLYLHIQWLPALSTYEKQRLQNLIFLNLFRISAL